MQSDLLTDSNKRIYAVNCAIERDYVHVGALYAEPGIPDFVIRLSDSDASVLVELPVELVQQTTFVRAWDVTLTIAPNG
jgi:uncharacterized protein with GYD domain